MAVYALNDNFDFTTDGNGFLGGLAQAGDSLILAQTIDPYNIGKTVSITFENKENVPVTEQYTALNFLSDQVAVANQPSGNLATNALPAMIGVVGDLERSGSLLPSIYTSILSALTWGDPHLVSFDKSSYDFQIPGEHTLAKSTADDFEIQVRQELLPGSDSISLNTGVATHLNGTKVGLYNYPRYEMHGTDGDDRLSAKSATTLMLGGKDNGVACSLLGW